jgi:hypothetical protein
MTTPVFKREGVVEAHYDEQLKSVIVKWIRFDPGAVRPCLLAQRDALKAHAGRAVLVDASTGQGALNADDQKWLATTFLPELAAIGVKTIVTVVPKSAVTRLTAQRWTESGSVAGITMLDAKTYNDAVAAIRERTGLGAKKA